MENDVDITASKSTISFDRRPIKLATQIYSEILQGIKDGHNVLEFKILIRKLIKEADPKSPERANKDLEKIWEKLDTDDGFLALENTEEEFQKFVTKKFKGKYLRFLFKFSLDNS